MEGSAPSETVAMGRGFPVAPPLIGSKLYEGDAFGGFVIYDDYRDSGEHGKAIRSVVTDGNQVNARDLEPREVALGASERARGWPRGSLNRRRPGCVSPTCRLKNIRRKCTGGNTPACKPKNPKTRPT